MSLHLHSDHTLAVYGYIYIFIGLNDYINTKLYNTVQKFGVSRILFLKEVSCSPRLQLFDYKYSNYIYIYIHTVWTSM